MTKVWWEEQQQPRDPGSDLLHSLFFLRLTFSVVLVFGLPPAVYEIPIASLRINIPSGKMSATG
jgi:hypothetical protein